MGDSYETMRVIQASPKRLFEAWLEGREHGEMTGYPATAGEGAGDAFSALDGLVTGRNLEVEPYHRIVQTWTAPGPNGGVTETRVELALATGPHHGGLGRPHDDGCTMTVRHSGLPPGQTLFSPRWWEDRYFARMATYFAQADNRFTRPQH